MIAYNCVCGMSALSAAKQRLRRAEEACPHWDYESDGEGHDCCNALAAAEREVRQIRKRIQEGAG